jgi:hypothetical protein
MRANVDNGTVTRLVDEIKSAAGMMQGNRANAWKRPRQGQ